MGVIIMKKRFCIISLIIVLLLSSCSSPWKEGDHDDNIEDFYSRENFSENLVITGYERFDDEMIACYYVYHSDDFKRRYGDQFNIKSVEGSSEMAHTLFGRYGHSEKYVYINKDIWCFKLKKERFSKWEIVDYYQCDENGNVIKK